MVIPGAFFATNRSGPAETFGGALSSAVIATSSVPSTTPPESFNVSLITYTPGRLKPDALVTFGGFAPTTGPIESAHGPLTGAQITVCPVGTGFGYPAKLQPC